MIYEDIDWNEIWKELMQKASWRKRRKDEDMTEFWNKMAKQYNESIKRHNRAEQIIAKLDIEPECTVLDIGSGPGTLAIPLAKTVRHVTVIDPSSGMLACLRENAINEGLRNITCINKRWEDVEIGKDIDEHDIVIASHSLTMLDIKEALTKMNDVARRYVYIFTFAGTRLWDYDKLWHELYSEEYQPGPDYIYLYNVPYEMGIYANVEISDLEFEQRYDSLDDAVNKWKEMYDLPLEKKKVLREYLSKTLVEDENDGKLCLKRKSRSAMIWWKKEK